MGYSTCLLDTQKIWHTLDTLFCLYNGSTCYSHVEIWNARASHRNGHMFTVECDRGCDRAHNFPIDSLTQLPFKIRFNIVRLWTHGFYTPTPTRAAVTTHTIFHDVINIAIVIIIIIIIIIIGRFIKRTEMGRTCNTYGGEENYIQGFGRETWEKKTTWKTQT